MVAFWMHGLQRATLFCLALLVAGLLPALPANAGSSEPPPGGWPWQRRPKIHGYNERPPATPLPPKVTRPPAKYTITITVSSQMTQAPKGPTDTATVMAYVPENAMVWFNDAPTRQGGVLREYESPPLQVGKKYSYHVRIVWFEDGHWVSETKEAPVSVGEMTCLYLSKPAAIAAALAELSAEDHKLAAEQRVCVVQPQTPLGAMGPPIKMTLKGQPVFLCCEDCAEKARKDPDKTLAKLKELKAKNAEMPRK
jgi:uncharacterized protein (TIGR03000 family)